LRGQGQYDFAGFNGSELEDLIPHQPFVEAVDRVFRSPEQQFSEVASKGKPIVPQVETWARGEGIELALGWKVEVARRVKPMLLSKGIGYVEGDLIERWIQLFTRFEPTFDRGSVRSTPVT
jgi:enoyl-CoA hydratase/carnithine racemase